MVNVLLDRQFDAGLGQCAEALGKEIVGELIEGIAAARDDCQIVFSSDARVVVGYPIHVSVKYRAYEHRTQARVEATLEAIGRRIRARFPVDIRLRGFPADNATLAAVNLRVDD